MDLSYLAEMTISEETQFLTVFEQQLEHEIENGINGAGSNIDKIIQSGSTY